MRYDDIQNVMIRRLLTSQEAVLAKERHSLQRAAILNVDRVRTAQMEALFDAVIPGVTGAAFGAILLVWVLDATASVDRLTGVCWAGAITACAMAHVILQRHYRRAGPVVHWRPWAFAFTALCLAEGVGWGWGSVALVTSGDFGIRLLAVVVTLGIAAGAIPVFGAYLPAFAVFFVPATIPYALLHLGSSDAEDRGAHLLMAVFALAMGGIGLRSHRTITELIRLRLHTEALAVDLSRQKDVAERANLAKSAFLAAASHDLRQPVHALGLFVGALGDIAMPPAGARLVRHIQASTDALDGLFTALLDISRLDAGVVEVHARAFSLQDMLERICRDHAAEAADKDIGLACRPSEAMVLSDPLLVERILRNLVANAVRYTDRGRVLVACRRRGDRVAVQVWDTGRGIPAAQQEQVFQEYFQVANPERDRTKGLGLGLAIVRRLSLLLDCPLVLRSRQGYGSCFEIRLPRADGMAEADGDTAGAGARADSQGLVIVIDNEAAICEAMSSLLVGWGHSVITAATGDEAIEKLRLCPDSPRVIIADYRLMQGESGIEVIERLRSEYNDDDIPALLVTGDTAPERLLEAQASGLALLHKPVSNSRLRAAIATLTVRDTPAPDVAV